MKTIYLIFLMFICFKINVSAQSKEQIIRLSEIEIFPEHLEAYNAILKEEAEASVRLEQGVIAIFPMYQKEHPNQVRIIEIYANQEAYQSHLKTAHFIKYKTSTIEMVKSLRLIDMESIDPKSMGMIFGKMKE